MTRLILRLTARTVEGSLHEVPELNGCELVTVGNQPAFTVDDGGVSAGQKFIPNIPQTSFTAARSPVRKCQPSALAFQICTYFASTSG